MTVAYPPSALGQAPAATPSLAAMEQAAEWFALLQSGTATPADQARWQAWLEEEGARAAWAFVERVSQQFQPLQTGDSGMLAARALGTARQRMARRQLLRGMAVLAGSGTLGWGLWQHTPLPQQLAAWTADHRTATGEMRALALEDGTRIWLNTATAVDLHYTHDLRRLLLRMGEMLVQTASDPQRPLVVDTPWARLQALGTRFTTRLQGQGGLLAVYEGAVRIQPVDASQSITVAAGRQVYFDARSVGPDVAVNPAHEAWSRGILLANGMALSSFVEELGRYRQGHLSLAPELADLPVLGSYPLHDTDAALAMLQAVLPIRLRHTMPWWTRIEPAVPG